MKIFFVLDKEFKVEKGELFLLGDINLPLKRILLPSSHSLKVGAFIYLDHEPVGQIQDITWISKNDLIKNRAYIVKAMETFCVEKGENFFEVKKDGFSMAVITLSDKGAMGKREDKSGPLIISMIKEVLPITFNSYFIIPDEKDFLYNLLIKLCIEDQIDIVITTGGTGVTSRDITPDVTEKVIEKRIHGFEWAMLNEGLKKTPHAIISRAVCGILKKSVIINLPGSPKAVKENLSSILPALPHFMEKLNDSPIECASC